VGSLLSSHYDQATLGSDPCAVMQQLPTTPPPAAIRPQSPPSGGASLPRRAPALGGRDTAGLGALLDRTAGGITAGPRKVTVEIAAFMKSAADPIVLQVLADVGRLRSRAEVRQIEQMLVRCPELHADSISFTMAPLWMPQLGDRSVAMTFSLAISDGTNSDAFTMYGQSVVVAYKNVSMALTTISVNHDTTNLRALAKTAMRNLRKANR
jgi:hypothetical protein